MILQAADRNRCTSQLIMTKTRGLGLFHLLVSAKQETSISIVPAVWNPGCANLREQRRQEVYMPVVEQGSTSPILMLGAHTP